MYDLGRNVEKNDHLAAEWYLKAANNEHNYAQFNIGVLYTNGRGVKQNIIEAYKWFSVSSSNGNENAEKEKLKLSKRMTPEQIKKAEEDIYDTRPN